MWLYYDTRRNIITDMEKEDIMKKKLETTAGDVVVVLIFPQNQKKF